MVLSLFLDEEVDLGEVDEGWRGPHHQLQYPEGLRRNVHLDNSNFLKEFSTESPDRLRTIFD